MRSTHRAHYLVLLSPSLPPPPPPPPPTPLQALITDHVKVVFFTNATAYGDVPAGGPSGDGTGAGTDAAAKACSEVCSNTLDMLCFVKYKCWSKFGGFLGLLGGLLLGGT